MERRKEAGDCYLTQGRLLSIPPESVFTILAAGPLEDLIDEAGPELIERIELHARRTPTFRNLLGGVWAISTPGIWARVEAAGGSTC
ncbi:DUF6869 domain-containing protein [Pseudomonas sp. PDM11]|uniref:DUF6869 domain-containing protein n=1 Tax=Pseudomonas sp. PDM11 TaxID=2769309 RepID=UPI00399ABF76